MKTLRMIGDYGHSSSGRLKQRILKTNNSRKRRIKDASANGPWAKNVTATYKKRSV